MLLLWDVVVGLLSASVALSGLQQREGHGLECGVSMYVYLTG